MAEWSRSGMMSADGRNCSSAASTRAWMRVIQAAKSVFGVGTGEILQRVLFKDLHLLLRLREHVLAELRELQAALVSRERLLEAELSGLHSGDDLLELRE